MEQYEVMIGYGSVREAEKGTSRINRAVREDWQLGRDLRGIPAGKFCWRNNMLLIISVPNPVSGRILAARLKQCMAGLDAEVQVYKKTESGRERAGTLH